MFTIYAFRKTPARTTLAFLFICHILCRRRHTVSVISVGAVREPPVLCRARRTARRAPLTTPSAFGLHPSQEGNLTGALREVFYLWKQRPVGVRCAHRQPTPRSVARMAWTRAILVSLSPRGRGNKGEGVRRVSAAALRCIPLSPDLSPARGERNKQSPRTGERHEKAQRHCERSEAIQTFVPSFSGLLRRCAPRNDGCGNARTAECRPYGKMRSDGDESQHRPVGVRCAHRQPTPSPALRAPSPASGRGEPIMRVEGRV